MVVTPAGGASKVAYVGTILHGQNLNVAVLLDSDQEGKSAYEQLVHQWIIDDKHVLMLGDILGVSYPCSLEDLFSDDYYMEHVSEAYRSELGKKTLKLNKANNRTIVERVEEALAAAGIDRFNKGRVAKRIMTDLAKKSISDLPTDTVSRFEQTIKAINQIVGSWKSKD